MTRVVERSCLEVGIGVFWHRTGGRGVGVGFRRSPAGAIEDTVRSEDYPPPTYEGSEASLTSRVRS